MIQDDFDPAVFVDRHQWILAKTMADIPHEYVVRGKNGCTPEDWDRMLEYIKEHGYWARWSPPGGRVTLTNIYLEVGDHKYWCNYPVINRELLENSQTRAMPAPEAEEAERLSKARPKEVWGHKGFPNR